MCSIQMHAHNISSFIFILLRAQTPSTLSLSLSHSRTHPRTLHEWRWTKKLRRVHFEALTFLPPVHAVLCAHVCIHVCICVARARARVRSELGARSRKRGPETGCAARGWWDEFGAYPGSNVRELPSRRLRATELYAHPRSAQMHRPAEPQPMLLQAACPRGTHAYTHRCAHTGACACGYVTMCVHRGAQQKVECPRSTSIPGQEHRGQTAIGAAERGPTGLPNSIANAMASPASKCSSAAGERMAMGARLCRQAHTSTHQRAACASSPW
jgi:hypothetical protein